MAKQSINIGSVANDGSGDSLRDAAQKINSNFTELYNTSGLDTSFTQSAFNKANSATTLSESAFNKANTVLSTSDGTYLNLASNTGVQLQFDPSGGLVDYEIANGSWLYVDSTGLTYQSNTTGIWQTFSVDNYGNINTSGILVGSSVVTNYVDTILELDLTKTINKLVPKTSSGAPHYHLADGQEGQIMYIVPSIGGEMSSEYSTVTFSHARWTNSTGSVSGIVNEVTDTGWWLPFRNGDSCLTLIFTDGYWNLPHGVFD